jgi:hypothetical protein
MCIKEFIRRAENNEPVFITEFKSSMENQTRKQYLELINTLSPGHNSKAKVALPSEEPETYVEAFMLEDYLAAIIYNTLSALGGLKLTLRYDASCDWLGEMLARATERFEVTAERANRKSYGRCINVIDRMMDHLEHGYSDIVGGFHFVIEPIQHMQISTDNISGSTVAEKELISKQSDGGKITSLYLAAANELADKVILGIDVGGSDIKLACSIGSNLSACKEFDWFPAEYSEAQQIIDPIILLTRLMRVYASNFLVTNTKINKADNTLTARIEHAIDQHISTAEIAEIVTEAELRLANDLISFDAIGMCFPDVVIKNKIVGGETFKTRGIRANKAIDYEAEMHKLADLNDLLANYCRDGKVGITNDGPMAAYTAAVELVCDGQTAMADKGIFAHTLGTELGTGWVDENGSIPDIPLEVYNFVIDLGSYPARQYQADDPRSINNFNTGISGTLQKYTSQSGAFRLALEAAKSKPAILSELINRGFIQIDDKSDTISIKNDPTDMRKPFLQFLMDQASLGKDTAYEDIFFEIGRYMGVTWHVTMEILKPLTSARPLFGRLVKNEKCFELMKTGAVEIAPEQLMLAADDSMAASPLMLQLSRSDKYTVAQFAQAIGAIHYANQLLIK